VGADMPDAGASRKRQIQVTPWSFSDAVAPAKVTVQPVSL
jgi:hypothetical protein